MPLSFVDRPYHAPALCSRLCVWADAGVPLGHFFGIAATFLYNFFACLLRAVGNSAAPLIFLGISAVLNIVLDLVCVLVLHWGVAGAAAATVFAQWISGIGLGLYTLARMPGLRVSRSDMRFDRALMTEISHFLC